MAAFGNPTYQLTSGNNFVLSTTTVNSTGMTYSPPPIVNAEVVPPTPAEWLEDELEKVLRLGREAVVW